MKDREGIPKGKYCDSCSHIEDTPWECICNKYYMPLFNNYWLFIFPRLEKCSACQQSTKRIDGVRRGDGNDT